MNNNKQINISEIRRKNRLISYANCEKQLQKLLNKKILSTFEITQVNFFQRRLARINTEAFFAGDSLCS